VTRISADQGVGIRRAGHQRKWSLVAGVIGGNHGFRGLTLIVAYWAGLVAAANSGSKASFLHGGSPCPPGRSRNAPFVRPAERMGAFWLRPRGGQRRAGGCEYFSIQYLGKGRPRWAGYFERGKRDLY